MLFSKKKYLRFFVAIKIFLMFLSSSLCVCVCVCVCVCDDDDCFIEPTCERWLKNTDEKGEKLPLRKTTASS